MFASMYEFLLFELVISKGKITKFLYPYVIKGSYGIKVGVGQYILLMDILLP